MTIDFQCTPPPHLDDAGHYSDSPRWWNFVFPNGRGANVALSKQPFRFDVEWDGEYGMDAEVGLTSEQVEAKLTAVADLPAETPEVA